MSPLIYRLRRVMVRLGDLPTVEADASKGLSNGAILERLKEITNGSQDATPNTTTGPGQPRG
jgi:hypothetical protein